MPARPPPQLARAAAGIPRIALKLAAGVARRCHGARLARIVRLPPPRGVGIAASLVLLASALGYGVIKGQHLPDVIDWGKDARDAAANSLGFRIAEVSLSGEKEVSREEILTTAGVTGRASLLFLDADAARARLMANPWIADAAVLKLYPDRLQISITERHAFALWQKDGHIKVIAADGTVLEPYRRAPLRQVAACCRQRRPASSQGFSGRPRALSRRLPPGCARRSWWRSGAGTCC